jgi:hypothetical protein
MAFNRWSDRLSVEHYFVFVQVVWALVTLSLLADLGPANAFLVWFVGFLVGVELLPASRLTSRKRQLLRLMVYVGYVTVAIVLLRYFVPL